MSDILPAVIYRDGPLTAADYEEAIAALQDAMRQDDEPRLGAVPRSSCCSICSDGSHTAESCHHNPLVAARRWAQATSVWCCYHCGFIATTDEMARYHFGDSDLEPAACTTALDDVAALQAEIAALQAEIAELRAKLDRSVAEPMVGL